MLPLLQVDVFKRSRLYCSKSNYAYQTSQKEACIRPCDTNNFTQNLHEMYHHTATESLHCLCGAKISWTLTLPGVSCQFRFFHFFHLSPMQDLLIISFSIFFPHKVSHHKVRKI